MAFVGRAHPDATDARTPKYVNSATTDLFSKTDLPYGLTPETIAQLRGGANLAIVEGPMDALAVDTAARADGRRLVAVAPLGTALTREQLATLNRIAPLRDRTVVVALDNDPAGRRAATAAHELLLAAGVTNARVPNLPAGQDPADVLATAGAQALAAALGQRRPLADLAVDQVLTAALRGDHSPESRLWALDKAAQVVARMPSEQRARQAVRTARALDLDAFRVLDKVQSHVPYDPTPQGPLGLPKLPRALRQRQRAQLLARNAARINAMGTENRDTDAVGSAAGGPAWPVRRRRPRRRTRAPTTTAGPTPTGDPPARLRRDRGPVVEAHHRAGAAVRLRAVPGVIVRDRLVRRVQQHHRTGALPFHLQRPQQPGPFPGAGRADE